MPLLPTGSQIPPRMRRALEDPNSTNTSAALPNNARVGADNEDRDISGLGAARPARAGAAERDARRAVLNQPQYQPVVDGYDG